MVQKGLKKGDVFEDGGLYYEVQSVLPNGHYISKRVDGPKDEPKPVEEPAEEVKETVAEVAPTEGATKAAPKKTGGKKK